MNEQSEAYDLHAHIATLLTEEPDTPPEELADLVIDAFRQWPKLRTCTFCGGRAHMRRDKTKSWVQCNECEARGPVEAVECPLEAADKWNMRRTT